MEDASISVLCMHEWALQTYFICLIDFTEESYWAGKAIFTLSLSVK